MKRSFLTAMLLAGAALAAFAAAPLPLVEVESVDLGGSSELSVHCEQRGVEVYLDYVRRGIAPIDLKGLSPGAHSLILRKDGYSDMAIDLVLAPDTRTTLTAALELKTGYLSISTQPAWAEVVIEGESFKPGILQVAAGQRDIEVRAFGYRSQTYSVFVPERLLASLSVALDRAPFEIYDFSLSHTRFNPLNAGILGSTRISFQASAPGRASIRISAPDGTIVASWELGPFVDWAQHVEWNGRDANGQPLPDDSYAIDLDAAAEPGIESLQDSFDFTEMVRIDSSLVIVPDGRFGVIPGSVLVPDAFPAATSSLGVSVGATFAGDSAGTVTGGAHLGIALILEKILDIGLGVSASADGNDGTLLAGARYATTLPQPFGAAVALDAGLSASTNGNPSWIRLSLPLGAGTKFFNLSLSPDITAVWEDGFAMKGGLGASLAVSTFALGGALSVHGRTGDLADGLVPAWPVESTAELRFIPAGLPLSFILYGTIAWAPDDVSWRAGLSLTGGLW
ncbi:MAG: PEGA domain-containing protein [Spirochaetales bacterium]|nr:MAG: PEGA domain-containing protein [Spirochaetales bacterium]